MTACITPSHNTFLLRLQYTWNEKQLAIRETHKSMVLLLFMHSVHSFDSSTLITAGVIAIIQAYKHTLYEFNCVLLSTHRCFAIFAYWCVFERPINIYNTMIQCQLNLDLLSEIVLDITVLAIDINVNNIAQTSG